MVGWLAGGLGLGMGGWGLGSRLWLVDGWRLGGKGLAGWCVGAALTG